MAAVANLHIEGTSPEAVGKYQFDKDRTFTTSIVHEAFQGIRITPTMGEGGSAGPRNSEIELAQRG